MNKAAKITHIQVLYDPIFSFLLSKYLLVGLLGHNVNMSVTACHHGPHA